MHVGDCSRLHRTHAALHAWRAETKRTFAGTSWEIYGGWSAEPSQLETRVSHLLARES